MSSESKFISGPDAALQIVPTGVKKDDVLAFSKLFYERNGYTPTLEEICMAVDTMYPREFRTSKSNASRYLEELEKDGHIILPRNDKGQRIQSGRMLFNETVTREGTTRA